MAEENQVNVFVDPASVGGGSTGRKRGRPRKDENSGSEPASRRRRKVDHCSHSDDVSVGQAVSGVLDGKFDAGYMLTVRVVDTGTVLRGVVFEPGRFLPISAANDIAPNVPLVRRAEIPIPNIEIQRHLIPTKDKASAPSHGTSVVPVDLASSKQSTNIEAGAVKVQADNYTTPINSSQVQQSEPTLKSCSTTSGPKVALTSEVVDTKIQQSDSAAVITLDETIVNVKPSITTQEVVVSSTTPSVYPPEKVLEKMPDVLAGNEASSVEGMTNPIGQEDDVIAPDLKLELNSKDSCGEAEKQPSEHKPEHSPVQELASQLQIVGTSLPSANENRVGEENKISDVTEATGAGSNMT